MPTRRSILMGILSAAGVGTVALVAGRLGARRLPAAAPVDTPLVMVPRAQWGAREPAVRPGGRGENGPYDPLANPNGWMQYAEPLESVLRMVIVHHSALPLSDGPVEIQRLHMDERGFADVGYHYLIDGDGVLYEGRPLNVRGAHTSAFNTGSVGICLLGNFENGPPAAAQLITLDALLAALVSSYPAIASLAGHKDCNPGVTLCPGANFYPMLDAIAGRHGLHYGI